MGQWASGPGWTGAGRACCAWHRRCCAVADEGGAAAFPGESGWGEAAAVGSSGAWRLLSRAAALHTTDTHAQMPTRTHAHMPTAHGSPPPPHMLGCRCTASCLPTAVRCCCAPWTAAGTWPSCVRGCGGPSRAAQPRRWARQLRKLYCPGFTTCIPTSAFASPSLHFHWLRPGVASPALMPAMGVCVRRFDSPTLFCCGGRDIIIMRVAPGPSTCPATPPHLNLHPASRHAEHHHARLHSAPPVGAAADAGPNRAGAGMWAGVGALPMAGGVALQGCAFWGESC